MEELEELCRELATEAVWLREQVPEDERGVFCLPAGWRESFSALPAAYENLGAELPLFPSRQDRLRGYGFRRG